MRPATALLVALLAAAPVPDPPALILPPGPAAEAWRVVDAATAIPDAELRHWPQWSDRSAEGWGAPAPWRRWVELVRAEAGAVSDPSRRVALAWFARARDRDGEAWKHFEACRDEPGLLAALAPSFFPGTPPHHPVLAGGIPAPLQDGTLLTPALPPRPRLDEEGQPVGLVEHAIEHAGFQVGETTISMRLLLERDGVQVDLHHLAGPPATVQIRLPMPPGEEIGVTYIDWFRLDDPAAPIVARLSSSEEEKSHEIWGRFRSRETPWPGLLPEALPVQVAEAGLAIRVPAELADSAFLGHLAKALGELLGVPSYLLAERAPLPAGALAPLAIHLDPDDGFELELAAMISLAEAFVLDHDRGE